MNDPVVQTYLVGIATNLAGAGIAFYLWSEHRTERFLLFWALAWATGLVRWLIHYPAESSAALRLVEGLLISVTMFFMVLGSYEVLTSKPWHQRKVVVVTAVVLLGYGIAAIAIGQPIAMGYALFAAVLAFSGACMWRSYRSTRLSGFLLAAATCLYQLGVVSILLTDRGSAIANSVLVPLYNMPLMLSIAVIVHQRDRARIRDSAEQMRDLYVRLARVEDDERRALHAELHDQFGASLVALQLELEVAANLVARDETASAERHLRGAREVTTEAIVMARDLMAELRPPALDEYGLFVALRAFADAQSTRLNLPITVSGADPTPRPVPPVEDALFRIAKEAVINAARHASAQRIAISLDDGGGRLALAIEDDGVGFEPDAPRGPDHWGLKGMRERARAVGGLLEVKSAPGAGTRVRAYAPRDPAAHFQVVR